MRHHTKFNRPEILSGQTFTKVQNLEYDLDLDYSKATFSQDTSAYVKLSWSPKYQQFRTHNRNSHEFIE